MDALHYDIAVTRCERTFAVGHPEELDGLEVSVGGRFVGAPRDFSMGEAGVFDVSVRFRGSSAAARYAQDCTGDVAAVREMKERLIRGRIEELRARCEQDGSVELDLNELAFLGLSAEDLPG